MRARLASILLIVLAACSRSRTADEAPRATTTIPAPSDTPAASVEPAPAVGTDLLSVDEPGIVGRLVVNERFSYFQPSEYCLDDGYIYAGAPARIGRLNIFVSTPVESLKGKLVVARGSEVGSLLGELRKLGPCGEGYGNDPRETPQMRSDWISPEGGFLTTRAKLEKLPCFRARSLRALELGEKLNDTGDTVVVELRNPFAAALSSLEARAHYEGGPGKPMPRWEKLALTLPPGGKQRLELAAEVEAGPAGQTQGTPRGIYRLHAVELAGRVGKLDFDVSIPARHARRR